MSKVEAGQIGVFKGKTGQTVVANWRGILVGRKTPTKSNKPGSDEQKDQRSKFGLITRFFRGLGDIVKLGYQYQKTGPTPMNAAVQYNLENAVTGEYPQYALNYGKIVLSNPFGGGEIDPGFAPTIVSSAGCMVKVSWQVVDNATKGSSPEDRLSLIIYSVTRKKFIVYERVVPRSALTYEIGLPYLFKGDDCHGYIFFTSPKGKSVSQSEYLGQFKVLA